MTHLVPKSPWQPQDVWGPTIPGCFFSPWTIWAPSRPFHGCFPLCEEPCLCGSIPSWRPKAPQPLISYVWAISAPCQATATKNVAKPQFHENYPQVITNKLGINAPNGNFIFGKKRRKTTFPSCSTNSPELEKKVCKSWSHKQIMWFPSGGLHIYVSALDSELVELELVASTSELLYIIWQIVKRLFPRLSGKSPFTMGPVLNGSHVAWPPLMHVETQLNCKTCEKKLAQLEGKSQKPPRDVFHQHEITIYEISGGPFFSSLHLHYFFRYTMWLFNIANWKITIFNR